MRLQQSLAESTWPPDWLLGCSFLSAQLRACTHRRHRVAELMWSAPPVAEGEPVSQPAEAQESPVKVERSPAKAEPSPAKAGAAGALSQPATDAASGE